MEYVKTRTIMTKSDQGMHWFGIDYHMNLYRGCSFGCIYCDSRSEAYHIKNFDEIKGKANALEILEEELSSKHFKGVVSFGTLSDPYNLKEEKYEFTRGALKLIEKYGFGVSIDTKSDLILRDIDLLKKINENNNVIVKFTITTPKDELSKKIEPHVCMTSKRLEAIKKLSDKGIFVGIMMNPVLPFLTAKEEDIKELVKLAYEHGAKFIHTFMSMTLRENQRDYYFQKLDKHFFGLKEKYQKFYGNRYNCPIPNSKKIYKIFIKECQKYGILYDMTEIIQTYKKERKESEQLSLF